MADEATPKTEEEMLKEWQDIAATEGKDAAPAADPAVPEKILDQDEIDSLLGVKKESGPSRGIRALLESNVVNYEKLPMLEVIFDKFERFLSTSLRHFTADNVDVTIMQMSSVRFADYLNSVPLPAGLVVVNAAGLDDYILLVYENNMIFAVVDILLGGRKAKPSKMENRSFTTIERRIMENLTEVVLHDLSEAFGPIAPVKFKAERMEVNPRFAMVTREANVCILVTVRINLEEREGQMQFCLPYATLEPIREQLLQQFMGEKFGQDNIWENHLAQELYHTHVGLSAVLDEVTFPLSRVLKWRLGDTVLLNARGDKPIAVNCGTVKKLVAMMGKSGDQKAVRILRNVTDVNNEGEGK